MRGFELGAADGSVALQLEGPGQAATRGGLAIAADGVWSRTRRRSGSRAAGFPARSPLACHVAASPGGERLAGLQAAKAGSAPPHPGATLVGLLSDPWRRSVDLVAVTDGDLETKAGRPNGAADLVGALARRRAPALRRWWRGG